METRDHDLSEERNKWRKGDMVEVKLRKKVILDGEVWKRWKGRVKRMRRRKYDKGEA